MEDNTKKEALRRLFLGKRDNTSFDLMKIASSQIQKRLKKIKVFKDAQKIGAYFPIGSEIPTQDIIQEVLANGKEMYLPKVKGANMEFRKISDFSSLERGSFEIMEPRKECPVNNQLDVILVPIIAISPIGVRLGYGHGYYDRFLLKNKTNTIALTLEKQIIKNIPKSEHDVLIDLIVTEDRIIDTSKIR